MIVKLIYISTLIVLLFVSCDFEDTKLRLKNSSNNKVLAIVCTEVLYSDSVNLDMGDTISMSEDRIIPCFDCYWHHEIRRSKNENIRFYLFNWDTLKKEGIGLTRSFVTVQRMDTLLILTEDQLDSLNWRVEYKGK